NAFVVDVRVNPRFDVLEMSGIGGALVNEILSVKIEGLRVAPRPKIDRSRKPLHCGFNHRRRRIDWVLWHRGGSAGDGGLQQTNDKQTNAGESHYEGFRHGSDSFVF